MKKIFIVLTALGLGLSGCKKEKGCMDSTATNYNSAAEEDDGSCTYEEEEEDDNGSGDGSGGSTDNGTPSAADNTMTEGTITYNLENAETITASGVTTITAEKAGTGTTVVTIKISGNLPTSTTTYTIYDHSQDASSCELVVTSEGKTWVAETADAKIGRSGSVTIEVSSDGTYKYWFNSAKLCNSAISPTSTQYFAANFFIKVYSATFKIVNGTQYDTDKDKPSDVYCTESGSYTVIDLSGKSSSGAAATLLVYLPKGVSTGTQSMASSGNSLKLENSSNTFDAYDGNFNVTRSGNEISFNFSGILTWDNSANIGRNVSGSGSCLIK